MTILKLLHTSATQLKSIGITNPKTSSEILLAHALGMRRLELYVHYDRMVTEKERSRFERLFKRRLNHEPLQYILGETEFMSLPFEVNTSVLIPRPESELLVEEVITYCKSEWNNQPVRILDVGAGSGNISVSLARYLHGAEITGIDISNEAVEVAQKNARRNHVEHKITLVVRDIFEACADDFAGLHIVVSNPPYVAPDDRHMLEKEIVDYEPHIALFTAKDRLKFFDTVSRLARSWLVDGGLLAFETGYNNGEKVRKSVTRTGFHDVRLKKDYANIDRIVTGINRQKQTTDRSNERVIIKK